MKKYNLTVEEVVGAFKDCYDALHATIDRAKREKLLHDFAVLLANELPHPKTDVYLPQTIKTCKPHIDEKELEDVHEILTTPLSVEYACAEYARFLPCVLPVLFVSVIFRSDRSFTEMWLKFTEYESYIGRFYILCNEYKNLT
jgi:hypothetical protein